MKLQLLFILLFLSLCIRAQAQRCSISLIDENQKTISIKRIRTSDSSNSIKLYAQKKQSLYLREGFLSCSIDSIIEHKKGANIYMYLGEKFFFGEIAIDSLYKTHRNIPQSNSVASLKKVSRFEKSIIRDLNEKGYLFAQIHKDPLLTEDFISIKFNIIKGERFYFDSIIYDKDLISYNYLSRYVNIQPNKLANSLQLKNLPALFERNPMLALDSSIISLNDKKVRVELFLKKKSSSYFSGIVGFSTNKNNEVEATGDVELSLLNTMKIGEKIYFKWKKYKPQSQLVSLNTKVPCVFKSSIGVSLDLLIRREDSLYTNSDIKAGVFIPYQNMGSLDVGLLYKNTISSFTDTLNVTSSVSVLYGLGYTYSSLDKLLNPDRGWSLDAEFFVGQKKAEMPSISYHNSMQMIGKLKVQKPINLHFGTLFLQVNSGLMANNSLKLNHVFTLGGINDFRGFYENSIFAKSFAHFSLEYRIALNKYSFVYAFINFGMSEDFFEESFKLVSRGAFGLGTYINTKAGKLHIAYAIGKQGRKSFNFSQSKMHIGYINSF